MEAHPTWLPAMFPMSPWSEAVMEALYAIFRRDFVDHPASYHGHRVWFFPEKDRGKENIFWHLVERDDESTGERLPDFRRSERFPPRQNSCRPDRIDEQGAMMEERIGSIRTGIQG